MKKLKILIAIMSLACVFGCSVNTDTTNESTINTANDAKPPIENVEKSEDSKPVETGSSDEGDSEMMEKFMKLELGMSPDKAKEIMGDGKKEGDIYKWKGKGEAEAEAIFVEDKLNTKFQNNLAPKAGTADLTMEKFNQIETGASYEDVKKIIGSEGELSQIKKWDEYTEMVYFWRNEKYYVIRVVFNDDKVKTKSKNGLR